MPPNSNDVNGVLFENDAVTSDYALDRPPIEIAEKRKPQYVWRNIILFTFLHLAAVYGGFLFLTSAKWQTDVFGKQYFKVISHNYPTYLLNYITTVALIFIHSDMN